MSPNPRTLTEKKSCLLFPYKRLQPIWAGGCWWEKEEGGGKEMAAGRPCFLSGILITASSNNSFILPSQPPWEVYITSYQRTGERTKPDNSCDLLVVSHDQNPIPFKSNPVFPIDSQFRVNPLTSRRLCSGTIAFTASVFKVRERP